MNCKRIAEALGLGVNQVKNTLALLEGGASIPFISRYRKEATSGLDEVQIGAIQEENVRLCELAKRKETIRKTIEEQGKLTDELAKRIDNCWEATELEDLYLPFKPKRRTRAEMARQRGLEPLAMLLQLGRETNLEKAAARFVKAEVTSVEEALKGARDILAEQLNETEGARNQVRRVFQRTAVLKAKVIKGKEAEAEKFKDYFDYSEPLKRVSSHRLLAVRRGEAEGLLRVSICPEDDEAMMDLKRRYVKGNRACGEQQELAVEDAYKRLLKPGIETEMAALSKEKADTEAIRVFAANLKQLLLAAPLGQKRVLGIDPGFRTGCKLVCLDAQGALLHNETMYPHPPKNDRRGAMRQMQKLVEQYKIEAIAIGNGTASRETQGFVTGIAYDHEPLVFVVSEDGASIYSASKTAREEFPDYDVTVRGAVSIGRRLMDPLAELVKIEAKSLGVGQYQHDVDQAALKRSLDQTVENCVNAVGVNVNTASRHLLTYVSGLGPTLAQNIVDYRTEHGAFSTREDLMQVPRMGAKAYEQCAGFLRIAGGKQPLDNSAVHPERYGVVEQMAKDLHCTVTDLLKEKALRQKIEVNKYVSDTVGLPTLQDILEELDKPGRDPREEIKVFEFAKDIHKLEDLEVGRVLPGIVTNITNFGCFVDVGIKENGLVHVSKLCRQFVSDPTTVVSLHQQVEVKVENIDLERRRMALTMILD